MGPKFYNRINLRFKTVSKALLLCLAFFAFTANTAFAQPASGLHFDGVNDNIIVPVQPALNISSAITIETWIKPTKSSGVQDIISKARSGADNGYILRTLSGWSTIDFWVYMNSYGWRRLSVPFGTSKMGQWHHIAATYDGKIMRVFINGVQAGQLIFSGSIITNNNPLTIGFQSGYTTYFGGALDETRIWNRALSQCEIAQHMNCELTGAEEGLAAYYKYNQGALNSSNLTETQLLDAGPNGVTGTLNNFSLLSTVSNWTSGVVTPGVSCGPFMAPLASASAEQAAVAVGGTIRLFATGIGTFSWVGPNGFTSTAQNPVIEGVGTNASGTYTVTVDNNGCNVSVSTNVIVAPAASGLDLDGLNDNISIPANPVLNSSAFTIESWIYPTGGTITVQHVLSKSSGFGTTGYKFPKTNDRWSSFSFDLSVDGEWQTVSAQFPQSALNQWNHLSATYDGYFMRIYLNGQLVGTKEITGTYTGNEEGLTIGNQPGRAESFKGVIDEIRVWNRALSQCEIVNNMQSCELSSDYNENYNGLSSQLGLSAYYRFNQGLLNQNNSAHNVLVDSSGNGNHGVLNNFDLTSTASNWVQGKVYGICSYFVPPGLTASANGSIFQIGSVVNLFAVNGNGTDTWEGPNGYTAPGSNQVINGARLNQSGIYTVSNSYVNCVVTSSTRIKVSDLPQIIADGPTEICPNGSVNLSSATAGAVYQWYKNGVLIADARGQSYITNQTGNYTVKVTSGPEVIISAPLTVTVVPDQTAPVPVIGTLPVLNLVAPATVTTIPTANDNCRGIVNGTPDIALTFIKPGTYQITWNYNDLNGNTSIQTQQVVVADIVAPVISAPGTITLNGDVTICGAIANFIATATDDSDGPVTITYSQVSGSVFPIGETMVTITASDISNNTSTATFTVKVLPTTVAPITGNTTICSGSTTALATASTGGNWSTDNSLVATVDAAGLVTGISAGSATITYANACGATASRVVTVNGLPAASISAQGATTFCTGGSVVLTANSGSGYTYQWNNNGSPVAGATAANFIATTTGNYSVTISNGLCTTTSSAVPVTVNALPSASISAGSATDFCTGGSVVLTANGAGTYQWFNNGFALGITTQTYTASESGNYTVVVTNNNGCSAVSAAVTVTVTAAPVASITAQGPTAFCVGGSVLLTANGSGTYQWSNNGTPINGATSATYTATTTGNYSVVISNGSCTASSETVSVVVNALPAATITAGSATNFCTGGSVVLTANGAGTYQWFNNGVALGVTTQTYTASVSGNYTVVVTNSNGCAVTSAATTVTVNAMPVASITVQGSTTFCVGGSVLLTANGSGTYQWSSNGTPINGATSATYTATATGNYSVVISNGSCTASSETVSVVVNALPAATITAGSATNFCTGGSVVLTANSAGTYQWFNNGVAMGVATQTYTASVSGNYTVVVTNSNGCAATSAATTVTVNAMPVASITAQGSTTFCVGGSVLLTANGSGTYQWSSNGTPINGATSATYTATAIGNYSVVISNGSCTASSESVSVVVNALPVASITAGSATNFCTGGSVVLTANSAGTYQWFNNGVALGVTTQTYTASVSGNYTVVITNSNGCSATSAATNVSVTAIPAATVSAQGATTFCNGGSVLLSANSGAGLTYQWSNNGTPLSGATSANYTATSSGNYTVRVNNASCVATSDPVTVTVTSLPVATITAAGPTSFCTGGTVVLTASSAAGYNWFKNGSALGINSQTYTAINSGNYTVAITNADGCSAISSGVAVTLNANPVVSAITGNTTVNAGATAQLSTTTAGGVWSSNSSNATVNATGLVTGFTAGSATISYTVTNASGCVTTVTAVVTVTNIPVCNVLPVAIIAASGADDFCNKVTLTGSTSSANASYKWVTANNTVYATSQQISLDLSSNEGDYKLYVSADGCTSLAATYTFRKQDQVSSYAILAYKKVDLGKYNKVTAGSIGVMNERGEAKIDKYSSITGQGAFVKAPKIDRHGSDNGWAWGNWYANYNNSNGNNFQAIYGTATVTLPGMQTNTASTKYLPNYTVSSYANVTLSGNYKTLTIRKGATAILNGTTFGTIDLEEGASVQFKAAVLNIENLVVEDGARDGYYSYVRFAPGTSVRVSSKVNIGSQVIVNPDYHTVTFYMADQRSDEEKFTVKGADTKVIANILMPNGKLRVTATDDEDDDHDRCDHKSHNSWNCKHRNHGHKDCDHRAHNPSDCSDDVYMVGLFVAETVESKGNTVSWSSFDCGSSALTVIPNNKNAAVTKSATSEEKQAENITTEEVLKVTVMPNPTTTYFTMKVESKNQTPINIRVLDANGRVVDAKTKVSPNSTFQLGANYQTGTYFAEMIQGASRKVVQLMKVK